MRPPRIHLVLLGAFVLAVSPILAEEPSPVLTASLEPSLIATPTFSEGFQKAHGNGTVVVTALVSPSGITQSPALGQKTVFSFLNNACILASERSRFKPRSSNESLPATFTYVFQLTAASASDTYAVVEPASLTVRLVGYSFSEPSIN